MRWWTPAHAAAQQSLLPVERQREGWAARSRRFGSQPIPAVHRFKAALGSTAQFDLGFCQRTRLYFAASGLVSQAQYRRHRDRPHLMEVSHEADARKQRPLREADGRDPGALRRHHSA